MDNFNRIHLAVLLSLLIGITACSQNDKSPVPGGRVSSNSLPPGMLALSTRTQWMVNFGYCGEMSFVEVGMYYGQYISQYDARALASPGVTQTSYDSQLLLGFNDNVAAQAMKLRASRWTGTGGTNFLAWIKQNIAKNFPVIVGMQMQDGKYPDYDHIVPIHGVRSNHAIVDPSYYPDDVLVFDDLGVNGGNQIFSEAFGSILGKSAGLLYFFDPQVNYGTAILGVADTNGDTLPVQVVTSINIENPPIQGTSRPPASPLTITATVSNLRVGVAYVLYRYNDLSVVPSSQFNATASKAIRSWNIMLTSGSQFSVSEEIMSSDMAIYRAVKATAP